jgi:virginiamycin A acetyltransferase
MLTRLLFKAYEFGSLRDRVIALISRMEGGDCYSPTLRKLFREKQGVDIGHYSHGGCFIPGAMDRHTTIGRYCSFAKGVRNMNRNHPIEFKSTHAFFYEPIFGHSKGAKTASLEYIPLEIGSDVWVGANALILPHTRSIGHGAVIAAGAVVNKDIPPYGIAVGNPARVVRFRFPPNVIEELLASKWWEKPIEELNVSEFNRPHLPVSTDIGASPEVAAF